jgi:hypothetical protein
LKDREEISMAKIETKVWEGPMDAEEKNRIVTQGEKRLGGHHFLGFGVEEKHSSKMVHITKTVVVEEEVESSSLYDELYREAIERISKK